MSKYREDILRLKQEGHTYNQIVNLLGCSKSTVSYYLGTDQQNKSAIRRQDKRSKIQKFLQEYKQSRPCIDCGERYPYWIMEFDHLGHKLFNISEYYNYSTKMEIIEAEVAKCDVVCANCHKNRTYKRVYGNGSNSMDVTEFYD